ncbi:hypothetical protein Anas_09435 [Armadillidium nasatum]|uniref:Uncharacterized protein n=1 Tax=Armadillidium nasatum TaxID=96803 RepID=A0A5N5SXX3_9CRUS|nr:hypothetical protein Anas_09435 [Armadillidium nasatum]
MVRSQFNRSHIPSLSSTQDARERLPQNRPRRNRSPVHGQVNYRRSSKSRRHSPKPVPLEQRGNRNNARTQYRRDNPRGHDARSGNRDNNRPMGSGNFNNNNNKNILNRRPKWRRNRNKKKRRGKGRIPPMSGGNRAPVLSGNRQPIASMRMRMDDYIAPRMDRMLPYGKSNDIERAVARARREASTRTKDTFWTKKLLDAETSHPNRWAHSGFKELYREELGYNEFEYKERKLQGRSPLRGSRDEYDRRNNAKRARSPPNKSRSSRERLASPHKSSLDAKSKTELRKKVIKSPRRVSRSRSGSRSVSRSPRNRKRSTQRNDNSPSKPQISGRKSQYLRPPNKRPYPRSLSCSPSTITSRSRSRSRSNSGSYSSYSRSSSFTSSSSSSTFTSSSSVSGRSYRSYSRSSKSWSRSSSIPRRSTKIKSAPLSKAALTTHVRKDKILLAKKTSNPSQMKNFFSSSSSKQKSKPSSSRSGVEPPPLNLVHKKPVSPVSSAPVPPVGSNDFYDKELVSNKSPVYVETVDKIPFGSEHRRGPESQNFKGTHLSRDVNINEASMRSEGEQSNTDSSSDDDDVPMKMTLSERFGKLAQLSSQRQEYEGVRMKIVREGGQDKKVYLEGGSRSPSPPGRRRNVAHEKWLREHKAEYDEYEERYGEFRHWDPHRDLPRELPPNWDDVNVRYRYYKESGYFGDRSITMEDYLKWEEWWYRYRDWLEKYGDVQEETIKYRGPYNYDVGRGSARERWIRRDKEDRKRHRF